MAIAIAVGLTVPAVANADDDRQRPFKAEKRKLKKYDFSGDDIEATQVRPDGSDMNVVTFATHGSLLRIRASFAREIIRSTEDI